MNRKKARELLAADGLTEVRFAGENAKLNAGYEGYGECETCGQERFHYGFYCHTWAGLRMTGCICSACGEYSLEGAGAPPDQITRLTGR